jgi:hypothetical protein
MDYKQSAGNVDAVRSDGTAFPHVEIDGGVTLGVGTYYFPLGSARAEVPAETELVGAQLKWAAAVAATITVETSNFPAKRGGFSGPTDVTDYSTTGGDWIAENPPTAYVPVTGAGNSSTLLVITAGGTTAGGAMIHMGNIGSRRCHIKVVTTVGGLMRVNVNGKAGS